MNPFITPEWPAPQHVKAYSTQRYPGESLGVYAGLNLGLHVGDNEENVLANRQSLILNANLPESPRWLNQVHGNAVVLAETVSSDLASKNSETTSADAAYTQKKETVCVVMTADCLPILLTNKEGTEVAAVHAGWRGLAAGIIEQTLSTLKSDASSLLAWLGPSISWPHYEVDESVYSCFAQTHTTKECEQAFILKSNKPRWLANIPLLAQQQLIRYGVQINNIYLSHECTYAHPEHYFSYRRDGVTGRMASLIWLAD